MTTTYVPNRYVKLATLASKLDELFPDGKYEIAEIEDDTGKGYFVVEAARELTKREIDSVTDHESLMRQSDCSMRNILTSLREEIIRLRSQNADNQKFIDIPRFREILTEEITHNALLACGFLPHQCREYTVRIRNEAFRIFALLLYLESPWLIGPFLEHSIHDIPVRKEQLSELSVELGEQFKSGFLTKQLAFKPHFFHRGRFARVDPSAVLPIVKKNELDELEGSFGAISEIVIAPSFHDFFDTKLENEQSFIRKRIRRRKNSNNDFEKERNCLALLGEIQNPNIVPLFYSYTFNDEHYLIFPRVSMDLSEFLRQENRFGKFSDITTFYTAFQGLASALDDVHNLTLTDKFDGSKFLRIGYHHDIRPANVLVTPETFVLADFGLSKFIDPDQRESQTEWKCGKGDYIAPECYGEGFAHGEVGRAIDIWALGCMVIDIATYMENGLAGLKVFRASRESTFKPRVKNGFFFHEDHLKGQVSNHIRYLQTRPGKGALWSLVDSTRAMLTISPYKRSKSSEVYSNFTYACTVALFLDCKEAISKFIGIASEWKVIHFLTFINFELIRLISWGDVLGLSLKNRDPRKFIRSFGSKREALDSVKQVQQILAELKEPFGKYNMRTKTVDQTVDPAVVVIHSADDVEEELRNMTTKRLNRLFDVLPKDSRKEADCRAQEYFNIDAIPKAPSTRLPDPETPRTEDDDINLPELEADLSIPMALGSCNAHLPPRSRWYIWDAKVNKPIPIHLGPSSWLHSSAGDVDDQSGGPSLSVLECIGFDPRRSVKAMHPGVPIHHILQPDEKFRVV